MLFYDFNKTSQKNMNKPLSNPPGIVIILNGPSAIGKSSIIKAFQAKQNSPWLETGIDHLYVGVIPPHWLDDKPEQAADKIIDFIQKENNAIK